MKSSLEGFASQESAKEVALFFSEHEWPGIERSRDQALESIRLNAACVTRDAEAVHDFLRQQAFP